MYKLINFCINYKTCFNWRFSYLVSSTHLSIDNVARVEISNVSVNSTKLQELSVIVTVGRSMSGVVYVRDSKTVITSFPFLTAIIWQLIIIVLLLPSNPCLIFETVSKMEDKNVEFIPKVSFVTLLCIKLHKYFTVTTSTTIQNINRIFQNLKMTVCFVLLSEKK